MNNEDFVRNLVFGLPASRGAGLATLENSREETTIPIEPSMASILSGFNADVFRNLDIRPAYNISSRPVRESIIREPTAGDAIANDIFNGDALSVSPLYEGLYIRDSSNNYHNSTITSSPAFAGTTTFQLDPSYKKAIGEYLAEILNVKVSLVKSDTNMES